MKKIVMMIAALTLTSMAAAEVSPFVGIEREANNAKNRAMVGVNADVGPVAVEAKYSWTAPNTTKFTGEKVDVDLTYNLNDNLSAYMKNELTTKVKHNATTVGVKVSF